MRKKKKTLTSESMFDNNLSYMQYVRRLTELSISMFKWTGLPDTVDERFLELALFGNGSAVFFKDDVIGFCASDVCSVEISMCMTFQQILPLMPQMATTCI